MESTGQNWWEQVLGAGMNITWIDLLQAVLVMVLTWTASRTVRFLLDHSHGFVDASIREGLVLGFREGGVTIPFPQRDVHMIPTPVAAAGQAANDAP